MRRVPGADPVASHARRRSLAMSEAALDRAARWALANLDREYPHHLQLLAREDADLRPPRALMPAFHGSFDWHSAVHGHWSLLRLLRLRPQAAWGSDARALVGRHFTEERLAGEREFLDRPDRAGWERPYGLGWLLQLCAELREWDEDREAAVWLARLGDLEALAARRMLEWLPRLPWPIRSGEHSQTAFAMGLALDWARVAGGRDAAEVIESRARDFYGEDLEAPIAYEPSGQDFLSPVLSEADLMRRVLRPVEFSAWLDRFVPDLESARAVRWLTPAPVTDSEDGKLAHLGGLNLSRAWMLEGITAGLPASHRARKRLETGARAHRAAGLAALGSDHYASTHWLGSFAVYLVTGRGLPSTG